MDKDTIFESGIQTTDPKDILTEVLRQGAQRLVAEAVEATPTWVFLRDKGISGSDLPHIFDRFYRVDKARSRAQGGAGLGLAIARWAVEINGGTIALLDRDTRGTTCRITLPCVRC